MPETEALLRDEWRANNLSGTTSGAFVLRLVWRMALEHPLKAHRLCAERGYSDGMRYHAYDTYDYAPSRGSGIVAAIYLVLGVLVAVANDYFDHLTTFGRLLSALLAVVLWPLLLFGIDIRVG